MFTPLLNKAPIKTDKTGGNMPDNHLPSQPNQPRQPKRPRRDYSLRMDNLSNEPRYPTEQDWQEYNDWVEHRIIRKQHHRKPTHDPNDPNTNNTNPHDPANLLNPENLRKQHAWKYGVQFKKKYRLSYKANEGLHKLARLHGYGHDLSDAKQGLVSKFIRALANPVIYWEDTRDPDIKQTDAWRLSHHRTRLWCTPEQHLPRLPREFTMTNEVIEALYQLACKHMVFLTPTPTASAVLRKGTMVASLLEVIGQGWLTPRGMPNRPDPPRFYRYRKPFRNVFVYGPAVPRPPRL